MVQEIMERRVRVRGCGLIFLGVQLFVIRFRIGGRVRERPG